MEGSKTAGNSIAPLECSFSAMETDNPTQTADTSDDSSSTSSLEETLEDLNFNRHDLRVSIGSNSIFLLAGLFYLINACWSLFPEDTQSSRAYTVIYAIAPFTYLANSLLDIYLANRIRLRRKEQTKSYLQEMDETIFGGCHPSSSTHKRQRRSWKKRVRKHAAHRRDLYAALSFFLAAFVASFGIILEYRYQDQEEEELSKLLDWLDSISIHLYMLSAIFALIGSRLVMVKGAAFQIDLRRPDGLEDLGDIFFLLGSVVDVVLCDMHFDDGIVWWPILSSTLWCMDACFYLKSDWMTRELYKTGQLHVLLGNSYLEENPGVVDSPQRPEEGAWAWA
jgi:hypothetical protein